MKRMIIIILGVLEVLLKIIGVGIHIWTTVIAYNWSDSILIALLTFTLPIISEIGWIIILWLKSGIFLTPFAIVVFSFTTIYLIVSSSLTVIELREDGYLALLLAKIRLKYF